MASAFVLAGSLVLMLLILASVLGAVTRRERFAFVLGVALFVVAHAALPGMGIDALATLLAVVGLALAVGSTVPLLRRPA